MSSFSMDYQAAAALAPADVAATDLVLVAQDDLASWRASLPDAQQSWLRTTGFSAAPGELAWVSAGSEPPWVAAGWDGRSDLGALGGLPLTLPEGVYHLARTSRTADHRALVLGWLLGAYRFNRYRTAPADRPHRAPARLQLRESVQLAEELRQIADAVCLTRELINVPAGDMLPTQLEQVARYLAERFAADIEVTTGDELLTRGFRTIHAVGRASADAPRLIDLRWGAADAPAVTLVGKGVCFDSGGLDLKPAAGMRHMKKDMGGAAHVLGLAQLIMARQLPVRLRILVPAVENAVAGNAYRPGDVIRTYQGLTVEIDNTDAEGRLVMCDALALAAEEKPELLVDFSTLTGAARVAVGTEIGAMFSNDDALANDLVTTGAAIDDPIWRLPLHEGYRYQLDSKVADTVNSASGGFGGAITAALFLQRFVGECSWAHFDIMAFNQRSRPGRPEGGEAMGLRALAALLETRFPRS